MYGLAQERAVRRREEVKESVDHKKCVTLCYKPRQLPMLVLRCCVGEEEAAGGGGGGGGGGGVYTVCDQHEE